MSLISRIEISNYLTEGLNANRRIADWRPMISAVSLRFDSKSALLNLTNGGGKTSIADLILYLLSRDSRLLSRVRDKCSPKERGFTHARIEFRDSSDETYLAPDILEPDPANIPGQTYVAGVVLNDKQDEQPIFYLYNGALEDSPCYELQNDVITLVPDAKFTEKTKSQRGCAWNKHSSKSAWEDAMALHISTDVLRRNVRYQCEGSDDKNAQFFSFKPRGGEAYSEAFFRAVVAPDLLTNILSTWAEEGEQSIEDTLYLSLSQIVKTDDEIEKKDNILKKRQAQLDGLQPLLGLGTKASETQAQVRTALEGIRKDAALAEHFGTQGSRHGLPGIPKSPGSIMVAPDQDPRVMQAIRGMFISADGSIMIFDKTLADLAKVDANKVNESASRKGLRGQTQNSQVFDFNCDLVNFRTGRQGGGHSKKGYSRAMALQIPGLISGISGALTDGLAAAIELAFDIAEVQIDTNPASIQLRGVDNEVIGLKKKIGEFKGDAEILELDDKHLRDQITARSENRSTWEEFQANAVVLPDVHRMAPREGKLWLEQRQTELREQTIESTKLHTKLTYSWSVYVEQLDQAGLEGIAGVHRRHDQLIAIKTTILSEDRELTARAKVIALQIQQATKAREAAQKQQFELERELTEFVRLRPGIEKFRSVFGDVPPEDIDPEGDFRKLSAARDRLREEVEKLANDFADKTALKSAASKFGAVFGDKDPLTYDPIQEERGWRENEIQAQKKAAELREKVEAIESFEESFPDDSPEEWILRTDSRRDALLVAIRTRENEKELTKREIKAIEEMSVVDDGHYEAAWDALQEASIVCSRLGEVLMANDSDLAAKHAAISAMSGLLPAPVFFSREAMLRAADLLSALDIAVPLIAGDELMQSLKSSVSLDGKVYLAGFVAGPYSRQARILLEPAYAEAETKRLRKVIQECDSQIISHEVEISSIRSDSVVYRLAIQARDGLRQNVREFYKTHTDDIHNAKTQIEMLKTQTTESALSILQSAKTYMLFGGDHVFDQLEVKLRTQSNHLIQTVEPQYVDAEVKASHDNLTARAAAIAYQQKGGEKLHFALQAKQETVDSALAEALLAAEELLHSQDELEGVREELEGRRERFHLERCDEQIDHLAIAIKMDADDQNKAFMTGYEQTSKDLARSEEEIRKALQVNFERAQIYKDNMGVSDADIEIRRTQIAARLANIKSEVDKAISRIEIIETDERPPMVAAARAIHELASEAAHLAVKMHAAIVSTHSDFPDTVSPVEAHPLYKELDEVGHGLRVGKISLELLEKINELRVALQELKVDSSVQEYMHARRGMAEAVKAFETAKLDYCTAARGQSSVDETALNTLEIDEIEQSDVTRLQSLTNLFGNLQESIQQDKNTALKTKAAAEASHSIALEALSRLIGNAQINLATLEKVMARYPTGRFFVKADIVPEERIMEILSDLKDQVSRQFRTSGTGILKRSDEGSIKVELRNALIDRVFLNPSVEFVNAAIWGGNREALTSSQSTGQKVALQFMWIVRQAEFEIERRLVDMHRNQAKKERNTANRLIIIDGIFSSLSNRELIKEAMNGLKGLGGNFQIIGLLHSETWVNDYEVFPVYLVGRKLQHSSKHKLISFSEGRQEGTLAMFSSFARKTPRDSTNASSYN